MLEEVSTPENSKRARGRPKIILEEETQDVLKNNIIWQISQ